jgi:23S rRNA (cytosine1962-C5)-methyltransferase
MSPCLITLKTGREKPVLAGHPWIFSGAVDRQPAEAQPGDICEVADSNGAFIARGYLHPRGTIRCRVLTLRDEPVDDGFFERRLREALALREEILDADTNSCRLVNGEGDRLPGLVVDKYAGGCVSQFLTAGMDRRRDLITALLARLIEPEFLIERSEGNVRKEEELPNRSGVLYGTTPGRVEIQENGLRFLVDMLQGQKTGFYLDQRENRALFGSLCWDRRVCTVFGYTGSFAVYAAAGGARHVVTVDSSAASGELAQENAALNGIAPDRLEVATADAFEYLRSIENPFDVMLLDPPAFARRRHDVDAAARAYRDINLQAMRRLAPGGYLLTCSCSQHVDTDLFRKIVFGAAVDAGRHAIVLQALEHAPDHPVSLHHREGAYLKALLLRIL